MKKTFSLLESHKASARVLDAVKHEVRKYVKRERRKSLPVGFDEWEFACKVGAASDSAEDKALRDVGSAIDAIAATGATSVYIEVLAQPAHRVRAGSTLGDSTLAVPTPTAP
ncbi:MAG: DUF6172 family protein [Opitutus sp.]